MKTVVLVWGNKFKNIDSTTNFWGIGDVIRGTVKLFQLSKQMNFKLIVDIQLHPISLYLKKREHEYLDFIKIHPDIFDFVFPNNVEKYINESNHNPIFLFTNDICDKNISVECKEFIKDIFQPNIEFEIYLNNKLKQILFDEYSILHYRLGDDELIKKNPNQNISNLVQQVQLKKQDNDILISDSITFKKIVGDISDIFMFDILPAHLGYQQHADLIKDTLFEFFLVTKSKKIRTYSANGWVSGFVFWIHKIYDVPLEMLNQCQII